MMNKAECLAYAAKLRGEVRGMIARARRGNDAWHLPIARMHLKSAEWFRKHAKELA